MKFRMFSLSMTVFSLALLCGPAATQARPSKFELVDQGGRGSKAWKLYRGNRIKNIKDLRWLKKKGITRVVALENWNHRSLMRAAKRMGIEYLPRFMARGTPGELGRKKFGKNVSDDLIKPGHSTYVYCTYGVHRTGGTIGRYRAEQGWTCEKIFKEAYRHGFRKSHYKKYRALLRWIRKSCKKSPATNKKKKKSNQ
jgi:hypothetical protein